MRQIKGVKGAGYNSLHLKRNTAPHERSTVLFGRNHQAMRTVTVHQQLPLFDQSNAEAAASLASLMHLVRAGMKRTAMEHATLSRELIADRMTELGRDAGVSLTRGRSRSIGLATIEKWLVPGDQEHVPSLLAVVAFCLVTGDTRPLLPVLQALGCEIMTEDDMKLRDYAKAVLAERKARKTKRKLEADL